MPTTVFPAATSLPATGVSAPESTIVVKIVTGVMLGEHRRRHAHHRGSQQQRPQTLQVLGHLAPPTQVVYRRTVHTATLQPVYLQQLR
jgi:hypothetical protein